MKQAHSVPIAFS